MIRTITTTVTGLLTKVSESIQVVISSGSRLAVAVTTDDTGRHGMTRQRTPCATYYYYPTRTSELASTILSLKRREAGPSRLVSNSSLDGIYRKASSTRCENRRARPEDGRLYYDPLLIVRNAETKMGFWQRLWSWQRKRSSGEHTE